MNTNYEVNWSTDLPGAKAFAALVDGELAAVIYIRPVPGSSNENMTMLAAALSSDPKIIDISSLPSHPKAATGWTWNGVDFDPPK